MTTLNSEGLDLVKALYNLGRRWAVVAPIGVPSMRVVFASWLNEHTSQPVGGTGLVIGPSSAMYSWHAAGWKGAHLSSIKFLTYDEEERIKHTSIIFDEQDSYSERYLVQLDKLLEKDADCAIFWLPPSPSNELGALLARHGFKMFTINLAGRP